MGALVPTPDILGTITAVTMIAGIVMLIIGIIALVGGIHSIKRKRWGLALAGAILSFPFLPLGGILGLLAVIFVSLGKGEFEASAKAKTDPYEPKPCPQCGALV